MFLYFFFSLCFIVLLISLLGIYFTKNIAIRFVILSFLSLSFIGSYMFILESFGSPLRMDLELTRIATNEVKILYYHVNKGNIYYLLENKKTKEIRYYYEIFTEKRQKQLRRARTGKSKNPNGLVIKFPFRGNYFISKQLKNKIQLIDKPPQKMIHPPKDTGET